MKKKKLCSTVLASLLVLSSAPQIADASSDNGKERVIVVFKDSAKKNPLSIQGLEVRQQYANIPAAALEVPKAALAGLKNNPNIAHVELDQTVQIENQTQDWGIAKLKAPAAWQSGFTGKGVKISVVDTGISQHPDLTISGGASFSSVTSSYADDNGHGTHVAGIIAARNNSIGTVGIAHEASIYAVKALEANGSGSLSSIIAGIDWSISNQMDIINLSLGTTSPSTTLQQVVDRANNAGILVVAAAGNNGRADGTGDLVNYPARYSSAIAVAATDINNNRASFSATGSTVEVAAPGVSINSTLSNGGYGPMSGTSMATPYVAGNLALMKQAYPSLTASQLRTRLSQDVIDLGPTGRDTWFGNGLVQAPASGGTSQPVQALSATVTTSKAIYTAGEQVSITSTVRNSNGQAVANADVRVTVTQPNGATLTGTGKTASNGSITFTLSTTSSSVKGTYQVKSDATLTGYTAGSATTSFQLR
ncbi:MULTISPECIES: S8 family serine peptidase [Exiguobacterium]|uniref:S8 family serine peptidase n=1 Tax=Exiguobacterium TaxID=33986 RepID=UPI001BEC435E|nr:MULTISPECIES: S8 family serine peptidase [Exiguobacterium]MCT4784095.1 S8 family serine peptidase [Exiguobacterium himgiriensis]